MKENFISFLNSLDKRLTDYFDNYKSYIHCKAGCSACCEKGDYPLSQTELEYLMQGYIELGNEIKILVQKNIENMEKGGKCPFLVDNKCSVYKYRPIVCRVHGLAYMIKEDLVKVPYCVNFGKNYSEVYKEGYINIAPITENLETWSLLKETDFGEIRNLADWLNL